MSSAFLPLPPIYCPHCDVKAVPDITLATGPHFAKAACPYCGRFLKWVAERMLKLRDQAKVIPVGTPSSAPELA
jgi:hypothetical protein